MRLLLIASFLLALGAGTAQAADGCGPGCHNTVNGACVVNGWEAGAVRWNECPAGAHPMPPCPANFVWRKHLKTCLRAD